MKEQHTEPKLLFEANTDENQANHVSQKMNNTSMQPDTTNKPPSLMIMHHFFPLKCSQFL